MKDWAGYDLPASSLSLSDHTPACALRHLSEDLPTIPVQKLFCGIIGPPWAGVLMGSSAMVDL